MRDADSEDLWRSAAVAARMLAGWACLAVALLDLGMGIDLGAGTTDRSYLIFHVVLLLGGLLLLGMGRLPKRPRPLAYALTAALAVLAVVFAALPRTSTVCCMRGQAVRHGFPFTFLAWDVGEPQHFSISHAITDLVFWFLLGLLLLAVVTQVLPSRAVASPVEPARPATHAEERATQAEERATHPEGRAIQAEGLPPLPPGHERAAGDENVRGLP